MAVATDEHALYPIHEEDTVVQGPEHDRQCRYLTDALAAHRPDLWANHDICLYWEPGNTDRYRAPDVSVIACPRPAKPPRLYLAWRDPALVFVAEVASEATRALDLEEKRIIYEQHLKALEYLQADPDFGGLRLWRMIQGSYHPVEPDAQGRVWSAQLGVWFGYDDDGFLRIYTAVGEMLPSHEELWQQRQEEAERRAEAERQAQAAERQARTEAQRREDAERKLAELTAEVERLRQSRGDSA
jgi:Uma2 family endonuclease